MSNTKRSGPEAMDKHIGGKTHQTHERQRNLASVNQQLATCHALLAGASPGPDSAVYGREDRAQNASGSHLKNGLNKNSEGRKRKEMKYTRFLRPIYSGGAAKSILMSCGGVRYRINHAVAERISEWRSPFSVRSFTFQL